MNGGSRTTRQMKEARSREPSTVSLSAFLSGFRDRYVGDNGEDFEEFWSSGEEVSESSDEEQLDSDEEEKYMSEGRRFTEHRPRKTDPNKPSRRRCRIQKAKKIVEDFIEQVENHRYTEFNWPPDPECAVYKYNKVSYYLKKCDFEEEKDVDENDEELKRAKLFLDQVRSSWGYAVTVYAARSSLIPIRIHCEVSWHVYGNMVMTAVTCTVKRINAGAKEKGKTYFPEEILNAVYGPPTLILVTLVLKEVDSKVSIGVRAAVNFPIATPNHKPELEECKLIPTPDPVV